jgi:carbamoyltransferase
MRVLGLNTSHDATVTLVEDGRIVLNLELERFTRVKNDCGYSEEFVRFCLDHAGWQVSDIDLVGLHSVWGPDSAIVKGFHRPVLPIEVPSTVGVHDPIFYKTTLLGRLIDAVAVNHHVAHAAGAFFTSPFQEAAILVIDGYGDGVNFSILYGHGVTIQRIGSVARQVNFPSFWEGICRNNYMMVRNETPEVSRWDQFYPSTGPGKIMALAAYGREDPEIRRRIYMDVTMPIRPRKGNERYLFGVYNWGQDISDTKSPEAQAVAAALQHWTNEDLIATMRAAGEFVRSENLCYAGGLALNCIATSHAFVRSPFKRLHVPPFANDAGIGPGVALAGYYAASGVSARPSTPYSAYGGPRYRPDEIQAAIAAARTRLPGVLVSEATTERIAALIVAGDIVAVARQGSECGPRALGHRSLLARADLADGRARLNEIKKREWYRPFAPIILRERAEEILEQVVDESAYMNTSAVIRPEWRERLSAVAHIDFSTRPQLIRRHHEPFIYEIVERVAQATGVPAVLNTSFNLQGPIVETPMDAVDCYTRMAVPHLLIDDVLLTKMV